MPSTDEYTLGLFSNAYPSHIGDYKGQFVKRMVDRITYRGVRVILAVKMTTSPLGYLPFLMQSIRLCLDRDVDILQAHYIPHSSMVPSLLKMGRPLVLKFLGDDGRIFPYRNRVNRALTRFMLHRADHIITVSEELRKRLIELGADHKRTTTISDGVDTMQFRPIPKRTARDSLQLAAGGVIILYVGRLVSEKGISEIVKAAERFPDARFIFIGPGQVPVSPKNCHFLGVRNHNEIPMWVNAADVCLLPSYTEGLSNFIMESLACGVPVIVSNVGGNPEVVKNGVTGLIIPSADVGSLTGAIQWMVHHPEERERMGIQGREDMINRYDEEMMIDRLMQIHRTLLESTVR